jgi:lipopolysaccharide biosynthesis protein
VRIGRFIPGWARYLIAFVIERVTPSNGSVRSRWLRSPELSEGAEVCIFVTYAPGSAVPDYSRFHAEAWAAAGFRVVLVMNTDTFDRDVSADDLDFASGVLVRENRGYDFGAWATALQQLPQIKGASLVALVNDSMFGPLNTFEPMLKRVRGTDADMIGTTESVEFGRHFQSFLLFFKTRALKSDVFWQFWRKVRAGGRIIAIYRYEHGIFEDLERSGIRCVALFPSSHSRNPTLTRWRSLIEDGFPYVKVGLLRDNPFNADLSGWQEVLREHGYDPALVMRQLG